MPQFEIECIHQKEQRRCDLRDGISTTDKVFVVFFTIEMVMKVIAFGFAIAIFVGVMLFLRRTFTGRAIEAVLLRPAGE